MEVAIEKMFAVWFSLQMCVYSDVRRWCSVMVEIATASLAAIGGAGGALARGSRRPASIKRRLMEERESSSLTYEEKKEKECSSSAQDVHSRMPIIVEETSLEEESVSMDETMVALEDKPPTPTHEFAIPTPQPNISTTTSTTQ
ncbi:hypothetical protein LR48_Vigan08g061300 [Vigna angularis]|uniref:Uncharacterized protein n=1 Tax=Phaseolus angularis TaxID=3914 RepID=A0A0L9V465_PHAAN|nr:hypothetical protein LR48_Vigan08g061300 [Vigna angularis]